MRWLAAAGHALIDLLFPPRCPGCGRLGLLFCPECQAEIKPWPSPACPRCGHPQSSADLCADCRATPSSLERIMATAVFERPLREAIHAFKYDNGSALAVPLGARMAAFWREAALTADVLVPVPLHRARLAERGYNQAAFLARELSRGVGVPADEKLLVRQRATHHQVGLGRGERQANVAGAFGCGRNLAGCRIVLIDDVATTGSTLEACAEALRAAGAASVWAFTLARARWGADR